MKILVTGATGQFGGQVIKHLLGLVDASQIAVSVRDPQKATHLTEKGIEVRQGDFEDYEALVKTFAGIDKLLIVSTDGDNVTRIRQHGHAVKAAEAAGVKHIVYTSVGNAQNSTLSLAEVHRFTEEAIRQTGIAYTFLRNNWYLENEMGNIQNALTGTPWVSATGDGKIGYTLRSEYALAAAQVLAGQDHDFKTYELSNEPVTQETLVKVLEQVTGKSIAYVGVTEEAYSEGLKSAGLPDFVVELLTGFQSAMKAGALDVQSTDFELLLGRKPLSLDASLKVLLESMN